jgi:N-acyl-L-homoserine lactone synthetase
MVVVASASEPRFTDKVADLLDQVDYRQLGSSAEREAVYRLRYEAYRREQTIAPSRSQSFSDPYDDADNGHIFGAYIEGELVGSVRIHVATREHPYCPSLNAFSDVLGPEILAGKTIVDSTRFVTSRKHAKQYNGLHLVTLRLCWMAVEHFEADHFLAAVRAEHQAFYRRTFGHRLVCAPRSYAMLNTPICLMTVRYADVASDVHRRYPFFRSSAFERRMLFDDKAWADGGRRETAQPRVDIDANLQTRGKVRLRQRDGNYSASA